MTKEYKELLLKDLCARLPYKVKICLYERETCILLGIDGNEVYLDVDSDSFRIESIKPYLRPMSSMTEVEKLDFNELQRFNVFYSTKGHYTEVDWLNVHHFDYCNLIEKGLALEAPEGMYK